MANKRKLPRCPLCGEVMHVVVLDCGVKVYRCKNYTTTGCAAQMEYPSKKGR